MDDSSIYFEIFMFWYVGIIIWVLLGLSILFFIIALMKRSRKLMGLSVVFMFPNILLLIFQEIEPVLIYLFIAWFALQIFMFIYLRLNKNTMTKK
ncbi:hypothetical protein BCI9360_02737 [Bacillus sp. CECT 9360]|nr:hypothetical protein BCI9360_02737 [Bacillus sp. CECT 9360]